MNKKTKNVILIIAIILIVVISGGLIYSNVFLAKINKKDIPKDNESLGITKTQEGEGPSKIDKDIINIALFGKDGSDERIDSIIIVSIDKKQNTVKLTSLLRDMYIDLPGHGIWILNHAIKLGGPELALKTINSNFDLDITDYVTINMDGFIKLIDALGGVQVHVEAEEIPHINGTAKAMATERNLEYNKNITGTGLQKLNGLQAIGYARIRAIGNDRGRAARQREVLNDVLKNINNKGVLKLPGLISSVLPYVETSLSNKDIVSLATTVVGFKTSKFEEFRVPVEGYYKSEFLKGMYVLTLDLEANKNKLHEFIYGKAKE